MMPLALMNHAEKYSISIGDLFQEMLRNQLDGRQEKHELFHQMIVGSQYFVSKLRSAAFYCTKIEERIFALILRCIQDSKSGSNIYPTFRNISSSFHDGHSKNSRQS